VGVTPQATPLAQLPMHTDPTTNSNTQCSDLSPVDYRIAIADVCGCDGFRDVVLSSDSNTAGAIYYRKQQLKTIAEYLGCLVSETDTNSTLRDAIRTHIYSEETPTGQDGTEDVETPRVVPDGGTTQTEICQQPATRFTTEELIKLAGIVEATPDPPYPEVEMRQLAGSSIAGPYLIYLVQEAYVDLYLSANIGSTTSERGPRAYYPFQLEAVHEIPESATEHPNCYRYIVDSSIQDPDYDNKDALDAGARINANAVILADVYKDLEGTVEAVLEGVEMYHDHEYDGEIIIPLQAPHGECYRRLRDHGISSEHTFALGGLKDAEDHKKINAAKAVREESTEIDLHGLGFGVTERLAKEIRDNPDLLDSVDYSTPIQQSIGKAESGGERLCTVAANAGAWLIEDIRRVSPLVSVDDSDIPLTKF